MAEKQLDTTTAAGKMVYRMLAVLAELERDLASERMAGALATQAGSRREDLSLRSVWLPLRRWASGPGLPRARDSRQDSPSERAGAFTAGDCRAAQP